MFFTRPSASRRFAARLAKHQKSARRRTLLVEALEPRSLLATILTGQSFFGGANDQKGAAIAYDNGNLFVAGTNSSTGQGIALKYSAPPGAAPTSNYSLLANTNLYGITAMGANVVGVGDVMPPTYSAVDFGGIEQKTLLTRFDNNLNFAGAQSANFFGYLGGESFLSDLLVNESGTPYIYASGYAQANGSNNTALVVKYNTAGGQVWRTDLGSTGFPHNSSGSSVAMLGTRVFVAGYTQYPYTDPSQLKTALWSVNPASGAIDGGFPKQDIQGQFYGLTAYGGDLYAVGAQFNPSVANSQQYLIAKYNSSGTLQWSTILGTAGLAEEFDSVVGLNGRIYAAGHGNTGGANQTDAVVMEFDPATGSLISTSSFGGTNNDLAHGITTDGTNLYVVGETKSFANAGNLVGSNDVFLLTYSTFTTSVAVTGGNMVVTDTVAAGKNDGITLSYYSSGGNNYVRAYDPIATVGAGAGAIQVDSHTVDVLANTISGNIQVNTLDGNDVLTVDSSMTASGKPIAFNGGNPTSGPPGDALVISGFGAFTNITHTFNNASDGNVNIDGYSVSYIGLEPVTDNLSATNRIFTFTGSAETVTLADSGAAGDTMSVISSTLGESITFANPTGSLAVNLTNGSDTLNFNSLDSKEPSPFGAVVPGLAAGDLVVGDTNGTQGGPAVAPVGSHIVKVNPGTGAQTLITSDRLINGGQTTVAVDPIGMIVVADPAVGAEPAQIILVNPGTGAQTLLSAGGLLSNPYGITIDASGNILVAEPTYSVGGATGAIIKVDRLTGAQSVAAVGGFINGPSDVTMDAAGNMFVAITGTPVPPATSVGIVKVAPGGAQTLVSAGSGLKSWTGGIVVDSAGTIYTSEIYYYNGIFKINPTTGAQSILTSGGFFQDPWDLDIEASGNLIVADGEFSGAGRVIRVNPTTGAQTSVSFGGLLSDPMDIAVMDPIVLPALSADLIINGDGGDTVNFPSTMINLGAGNADIGTTVGQPIQDINFTGGGLQTTSNVFLNAGGAITTTTTASDVAATSLTATAAAGIDLDTTVTSISATITAAGNIQVEETDGLSDLLLDAGAGNVTLTTGGAIVDTSGDGNDIVATNLLLKSTGGIGVSGNPIEVAVTNADIANITSGGIFVTDTAGGLILLDSALDADALAVSGVGGNGLITALSPLTIASTATTIGGMTYTATDSGGAGDDLTINAAVTVSDSSASLTFNAGDNFLLNDTASISAATTATINIDAGNADVGVGAVANIFGALVAPGGAFLNGNTDNDTFNITGPSATALDSITAAVTVNGGGGTNNLNLSDANDATPGDTATITHTTVEGLGGSPGIDYTFSNIANLDVTATSATDNLTTNLGTGPAASPTDFNGLVSVNVRGNGGDDNMFLHVADSNTNASLDFVRLFGDAGGDNFGGPAPADHIRPVLATGQTQITINGDAEAKLGPGPVNPGTTGTLTATDRLYLDVTTTDSGAATLPVVIVDTNGGYADTANTVSFRYNGIEDIDLYDGGVLTNTAIGDFLLRATDQADYIQFTSASQVNPIFRIRVGNLYYPTSGGNYGPYTTGTSKIFVYGRGGNDTISMYNTRLNAAFFGEGGDDILTGGYGDDLLVGGSGNDRINGGAVGGNDEVWGDDYNPAVDGVSIATISLASQTGTGNDQINTFGGNDTVYGQGGNDIILTGAGDDYINGGPGDDQLDGQAGNDRIYGGAGNDVATGSDGNDVVAGNDGIDTLYGRLGNDILIGGLGQDILNGNEGGDALVGDESVYSGQSSQSLAKNDARDAALLALLNLWGPSPTLANLGTFNSAGDDGSVDTLWGGADADAFFGIGALLDIAADRNVIVDLN